jgi:hypothetical protein
LGPSDGGADGTSSGAPPPKLGNPPPNGNPPPPNFVAIFLSKAATLGFPWYFRKLAGLAVMSAKASETSGSWKKSQKYIYYYYWGDFFMMNCMWIFTKYWNV